MRRKSRSLSLEMGAVAQYASFDLSFRCTLLDVSYTKFSLQIPYRRLCIRRPIIPDSNSRTIDSRCSQSPKSTNWRARLLKTETSGKFLFFFGVSLFLIPWCAPFLKGPNGYVDAAVTDTGLPSPNAGSRYPCDDSFHQADGYCLVLPA